MRRRDALKTFGAMPLALLNSRASGQSPAKYQATWPSIDSRATPAWFSDAKFGIFIHWGLYSVPSYAPVNIKGQTPYAEWYWHSLTEGQSGKGKNGDGAATWAFHQRVYGSEFPYQNFAPLFRAEMFDPDQWADLFVASGAKYVALTSKHHEGFTLWRSEQANRAYGRPWNAVDIGPKRDLLMEVSEAGRSKGLRMGIYYSLYEWYNPLWLHDKPRFVREHLFPQFKDVVTHSKPAIIFSDGEWELESKDWNSPELLQWLLNESTVADEVVINDRWGKDCRHKHGGYYTTEYTSGMQQSNHPWEESRGIGFSYGYNRNERLQDYHSGRELLMMLIDTVCRGGNLLLDIGPTADGRVPVIMQERLRQIGSWLQANGDAIYGTRACKTQRQFSSGTIPKLEEKEFMSEYNITNLVDQPPAGYARVDAFFTSKGNTVFAILPHWPVAPLQIQGWAVTERTKISLLESGETVQWERANNGFEVRLKREQQDPLKAHEAYVLKIEDIQAL
jgi:alpha-L-fucosidase